MNLDTWKVYLLQDQNLVLIEEQRQGSRLYYVGMTNNVAARYAEHRTGKVTSTKWGNWKLIGFLELPGRKQAAILEQWLKAGDSRTKREEMRAMIENMQTDADSVSAFYLRALRWFNNRQRKGKV